MRVFKVSDGTSWVARLHEAEAQSESRPSGWDAILFEQDVVATAQRLVYRPRGWLTTATPAELAAALEEGVLIRARWGD